MNPVLRTKSKMLFSLAALLSAAACAPTGTGSARTSRIPAISDMSPGEPYPDPRVGLKAGADNAGEAVWNLRVISETPQPAEFKGQTNSDLAFIVNSPIEGIYRGSQCWNITNPAAPVLKEGFVCPASQSDVSVYRNLLFVSGEGTASRIDCGVDPVKDTVSKDRLRGLRIFDISDVSHPKNVGNVQTCRGSHTHSLLVDPKDPDNVYVYISGSAGVRSPNELAGCIRATPDKDPNSALFRIEVIKIPLAHPEQAAIVSSPRIFNDLTAPARHGDAPEDVTENRRLVAEAKAKGGFVATIRGDERVLPPFIINPMLDSVVKARGGTGPATAADSASLRSALQGIIDRRFNSAPARP